MDPTSAPEQAAPALPGYRFLEQIAQGGYSHVHLYEQEMPRRKVAVKVLYESGLPDAARHRFTAEANAMAGLADHPNIVQVFDAAITADGRPYLVMQYYPRPNLGVRARREHFSVADALRIGIQISSAVETAHRNGILHRDIKPHNILTGQFGVVALTDFGIATTKDGADDGQAGISVRWSAPEVLFGASDGDERSDVYSLGATLWHLLAGRSPFDDPGGDNSDLALMGRIQSEPPPRLPRRDVPDDLDRLLRQAMAKEPAARPQTALDLARGLQAIERELRLPLTQIVVPAEQPPGGADPATGDNDATRVRGVLRIDPPPGAPAAAPARRRQMPADAPAAITSVRPAVASPTAAPEPSVATRPVSLSRSNRIIGIAAAGLLAILAIGLALAFAQRGGGHPAAANKTPGHHDQNAVGPGATAPGTPVVVAARASSGEVRFRWTYANHAAGDVFRWHRVSGGTGPTAGTTKTAMLLLAAPKGQSVCVTVQVVRADGSQASDPSAPECGS